MTDVDTMNTFAKDFAEHLFYRELDIRPFVLYFRLMSNEDIRALLGWSNNMADWAPREYPLHYSHYQLVAACILRYYYIPFLERIVVDEAFAREKVSWERILNSTKYPMCVQNDSDDSKANTELEDFKNGYNNQRQRTFSRDTITIIG